MAGTDPSFSAAEFRANIKAAMQLGLPNTTMAKPTFTFVQSTPTYPPGTKLDESGKPYDLTIQKTSADQATVQIDCAVDYSPTSTYTVQAVGDFDPAHAILTVLDVDYAKVTGADYVLLGGDKYEIRHTTNLALFDVDVYQLFLYTLDET